MSWTLKKIDETTFEFTNNRDEENDPNSALLTVTQTFSLSPGDSARYAEQILKRLNNMEVNPFSKGLDAD